MLRWCARGSLSHECSRLQFSSCILHSNVTSSVCGFNVVAELAVFHTTCFVSDLPLCIQASVVERSAHCRPRLPGAEMALSVEPVMLSKAPQDAAQGEPQPSTSASHFCIETSYPSGAMATMPSPASGRLSAKHPF